jgi:PAS domain S-box-containing protein
LPVILGVNVATAVILSSFQSGTAQLVFPLLITLCYGGGALLLRRMGHTILMPGSLRQTLVFISAVVLIPATAALAGCIAVNLLGLGLQTPQSFGQAFRQWWVGDLNGILTVLPVVICFVAPFLLPERGLPRPHLPRPRQMPQLLLDAGLTFGALLLIFVVPVLREANAFYLCFIPLTWSSLRHGLPGATLSLLLITMGALVGMHLTGSNPTLITHFLLFEGSAAVMGFGLGLTVSRRARAEEDRRRLLSVLEASTDLVATTDATGLLQYANQSLLRHLGMSNVPPEPGINLLGRFPEKHRKLLLGEAIPAAIETGSWMGESALSARDGAELPVSVVLLSRRESPSEPASLSFVMRDITRQKEAEAKRIEGERRMLQLQKLESLGVLAGGIAHDFNNLLTIMLGHASLARLEVQETSQVQDSLRAIEKAAISASQLCQQLLAYAGKNPLAFVHLSPAMLIEETLQLLRVSVGSGHKLELRLKDGNSLIHGDIGQLRQVIMNLVLNAAEAIGAREGCITLGCERRDLSAAELARNFNGPALRPGPYLVLLVQDTGMGMEPGVISRIFEPFYTTKFTGHGLGLAAVAGIVRSHLGGIHVSSTPGVGTRFELAFPVVTGAAGSGLPQGALDTPALWHDSGRVLIVDDEPEVRRVVGLTLRRMGYEVIEAEDGFDGFESFRRTHQELRFVLLDLTMPRMDGEECFHRMHGLNPAVPVILMSGFSEKLSLDRFTDARPAAFLAKPVNVRTLGSSLRRLFAAAL